MASDLSPKISHDRFLVNKVTDAQDIFLRVGNVCRTYVNTAMKSRFLKKRRGISLARLATTSFPFALPHYTHAFRRQSYTRECSVPVYHISDVCHGLDPQQNITGSVFSLASPRSLNSSN
jgi:hypothetical protein